MSLGHGRVRHPSRRDEARRAAHLAALQTQIDPDDLTCLQAFHHTYRGAPPGAVLVALRALAVAGKGTLTPPGPGGPAARPASHLWQADFWGVRAEAAEADELARNFAAVVARLLDPDGGDGDA